MPLITVRSTLIIEHALDQCRLTFIQVNNIPQVVSLHQLLHHFRIFSFLLEPLITLNHSFKFTDCCINLVVLMTTNYITIHQLFPFIVFANEEVDFNFIVPKGEFMMTYCYLL